MTVRTLLPLILLSLLSAFSVFAQERQCIAVVISGSESRTFWSEIIDGATIAGKELGIDVHARGTVNDMDSEAQKFILQSIIHKYHCKAAVIAPSDASRNHDVTALKSEGTPTIYIDRDTGGDRVAVVQTDNYAAGKLAARKMAKALEGRGNEVVLFRIQKGIASTDLREAGFIEQAQELGLKIVSSEFLGTRVGDARWKARVILSRLEHVDGLFTPNDTSTIGVIKALELERQHQDAIHIGFDESEYIIKSHKAGKLHGYIVQQPFEIGYLGVHAAFQAITDESIVEDINPPVIYID